MNNDSDTLSEDISDHSTMINSVIEKHIREDIYTSNPRHGWINRITSLNDVNQHVTSIKLGIALEKTIKDVVKITRPAEQVPSFIRGRGVSPVDAERFMKDFGANKKRDNAVFILTKLDRQEIKNALKSCDYIQEKYGKLNNRILKQISKDNRGLLTETDKISVICVDLAIKDKNGRLSIFELKSSGDIDAQKARALLFENIIVPYIALDSTNAKFYVGILQNNRDPDKSWGGSITQYIDPKGDMLLVENDFLTKIVPKNYSPEKFKNGMELITAPYLYRQARGALADMKKRMIELRKIMKGHK